MDRTFYPKNIDSIISKWDASEAFAAREAASEISLDAKRELIEKETSDHEKSLDGLFSNGGGKTARAGEDGISIELPPYSCVYLRSTVESESDARTLFFISDDTFPVLGYDVARPLSKVFVNGDEISPAPLPLGKMCYRGNHLCLTGRVCAGRNEIVVKLFNLHEKSSRPAFSLFTATPNGTPHLGRRMRAKNVESSKRCSSLGKTRGFAPFVKQTTRETQFDVSGHEPGLGGRNPSAGRFGFTKGDGVLDFSMPFLAVVSGFS